MKHLRRFLKRNLELRLIQRNIFHGKPMVIDHIAHRTFENDNVINDYTQKYTQYYLENDKYNFEKQNAYAKWLNFNGNKFDNEYINSLHLFNKTIVGTPRIFISTYSGIYNDPNFISSNIDLNLIDWHISNPNEKLSYDLYKKIYEKNQYLAWTLVFRNKINHIGIQVDNIENILEKTKQILPLNNPDSPLQISKDKKLLQFSTKSTLYPVKFKEGAFEIPRNFIEFIERKDGREGFSEKNANVVVDSTSI